jgi:membrane protein DedA with SNARE-associated domain
VEHAAALLQSYFSRYGYWTIALALLLENAGVPVPGETVLLFASFLAYSQHELRLPYIILVGTLAAMTGDNIGYALGRWGGRWLLDRYRSILHLEQTTVEHGERLFDRYGPAAIFFARFIFGMRVIAGPLAGVLRMHWPRFATFNLLGAATWVTIVSVLGYTFGKHWGQLVPAFRNVNIVLAVVVALAVIGLWWKYGRNDAGARPE